MKEKIKRKPKDNVKISFIKKDKKEVVVQRTSNLLLEKFFNICLDHLRPWINKDDFQRRDEAWSWSVGEIKVGSGHHVKGDIYSPLAPLPEWADPYKCISCGFESDKSLTECPICGSILRRQWGDLEIFRASTPIITDTEALAGSIVFTGIFPEAQANEYPITEMGMYLSNGELLAITTFPAIHKTEDVAMKVEWEIYFE